MSWVGGPLTLVRCALLSMCLLFVLLLVPAQAWGQSGGTAEVNTEENFRSEPNGQILGQLSPGTVVQVEGTDDNWTQVTVEGYVWTRSMQILQEDGLDLIVTEPGGENLRDEPQGRIAGWIEEGAQLEELGRVPGWVNVRRTGWIWTPSITVSSPPSEPPSPPAQEEVTEPSPEPEEGGAPSPEQEGAEEEVEEGSVSWIAVPETGLELFLNPQGGVVGEAQAGADLRILEEEGEWARVQLEGWVRIGDGTRAEADGAPPLEGVTPADLRADPARFQGREVTVELQFISLERAEAIRTEFEEGEPFLLTRAPGGQRSFVYVAISQDQVAQAQELGPLDRLQVTGRVRAGTARYTGNPILDLISLERVR